MFQDKIVEEVISSRLTLFLNFVFLCFFFHLNFFSAPLLTHLFRVSYPEILSRDDF